MTSHLDGLPTELTERISALATDLNDFVTEARDEFDGRSERWRDGDAGVATDGWLEDVGNLADELENLPAKPES